MFCSDKPINNTKEDMLNRSVFSEQLAKAILSYTSIDNFTVSLCGKWGSGKTSILNMLVEYIDNLTNSYEEDAKPLESLLEGMAEYYSVELAEKTLRGMTENALACKSNGGIPPIGYVADENLYYQIDPVLAPAVIRAYERYLEGATIKEIAKEINAKGIRSKRGKEISENTVSLMLHNRKYIGEYRFRDIVVPNGIPAIVSQELFDRVQERMAANKKAPAKHKAEEEYLLTTKLFCGKCKFMMAGESGTSQNETTYRYYKCPGVKYHRGCDKKTVRKDWIEDLVIRQIKAVIFDDDLIEKLADMVIKVQEQENTAIPILQQQLAETEKGIENMLNAIQQGFFAFYAKSFQDSFIDAKR